jgi:(1->4)-alpha-D-glucan 1-alpha-D-glucosylmutase
MRVPVSTYRLQFTPVFGFAQAQAIVTYLSDLGITDIYASPIFQARKGSEHGYDVVDPNQINAEIGTRQEFDALLGEAQRRHMGWVQDIVPNHMAYDGENRMLMDVLEKGPSSPFRDFFDIDWNHPYEAMRGKVLAPFLGGFYGECLENGDIKLAYDESGLAVHYFALRFPASIESYSGVFSHGLNRLRAGLGAHHPDFIKLLGVLYTLKNLPATEERSERADQIIFVKSLLWELYTHSEAIRAFIDANVARFNGTKGNPESFIQLDQLLGEQLYRLSFWKVAAEELNYRRFFNINELISMRVEDEQVFQHAHRLVFELAREGKLTGLRVDHIDGLYDPLNYLVRIREKLGDIYLCVEKILALDETLPPEWPVQGTTGYEFLNYVNGIFCDRRNEKKFTRIYDRFASVEASCSQIASEKKRLIIGRYMAGDIENLAHLLKRISSRDRYGADVTLYGLKRALVEVLTFFPVYRSYINHSVVSQQDRLQLSTAVEKARQVNPGLLLELNFIERFLLLRFEAHMAEEDRRAWTHFVMRFQQLTGPLMAKGFEDTTLYVYNRLLSLNDVGGDPEKFGISVDEFHRFNLQRAAYGRYGLNATATHDAKRGEDARARINVLSELPDEWEKNVREWARINRGKKTTSGGREMPDRNDEYFLYQTLLGAFPLGADEDATFIERLKAYAIKAVREAKLHTGWLRPDDSYEQAFVAFIERILERSEGNPFLASFLPFTQKIAYFGMFNSLSQALIKMTAPGVPDFYQGSELWDFAFVDPDNRRRVDFNRRMELLAAIKKREADDCAAFLRDALQNWGDGVVKLYVTYKTLNFRRAHRALFLDGDYLPLRASQRARPRVFAFCRNKDGESAATVVPRRISDVMPNGKPPLGEESWGEEWLAVPESTSNRWYNVLTGEELLSSSDDGKPLLLLKDVFGRFPIALLHRV